MLEEFKITTAKGILDNLDILQAVFLEKTFNFFVVSALGLGQTEHSLLDEETH